MIKESYNGEFWNSGEQPGDSRADIDIKRSSRTLLSPCAASGYTDGSPLQRVPAQLVDTPMIHRFKEYLRSLWIH